MFALASSGKNAAKPAILIGRFVNGKFAEGWINYDGLGLMQQICRALTMPQERRWIGWGLGAVNVWLRLRRCGQTTSWSATP